MEIKTTEQIADKYYFNESGHDARLFMKWVSVESLNSELINLKEEFRIGGSITMRALDRLLEQVNKKRC